MNHEESCVEETPIVSEHLPTQHKVSSRNLTIALGFISVMVVNAIYFLRMDRVVGQFIDDAWYIVLAKSIAEHGSYQLISSPIQGIQPAYPPGFPFLIAVALKIFQLKPEELWMLKGISVIAMNFIGLGVYRYCRQIKHYPPLVSFLSALMIVLMPAYVFIVSSSVMSECVFTCVQLWAVVRLETAIKNKTVNANVILSVILLASATFFVRSLGIALIIGILFQLIYSKYWKFAAAFVIGVGLTIAPWMAYKSFAYPNNSLRGNHGGHIVDGYLDHLTFRIAGEKSSGIAGPSDYLERVVGNIRSIMGRDVLGLLLPATLRKEARSGEEIFGLGGGIEGIFRKVPFATQAMLISFILSLVIIIGFVSRCFERITSAEITVVLSLFFIVIWPWLTFRFVLPLAPFLIAYFVDGLKLIGKLINHKFKREDDLYSLARIAFACFTFFFVLEHVRYIQIFRTEPESLIWVNSGRYLDEVCAWAKEKLPADVVICSTNPAKVFLMTGHQGVAADLNPQTWGYWKDSGVRYQAFLRADSLGPFATTTEKYKIIHETDTTPSYKVIDLGEPAQRESWDEFRNWYAETRKAQSPRN